MHWPCVIREWAEWGAVRAAVPVRVPLPGQVQLPDMLVMHVVFQHISIRRCAGVLVSRQAVIHADADGGDDIFDDFSGLPKTRFGARGPSPLAATPAESLLAHRSRPRRGKESGGGFNGEDERERAPAPNVIFSIDLAAHQLRELLANG